MVHKREWMMEVPCLMSESLGLREASKRIQNTIISPELKTLVSKARG